jgi:peptidoglycan-associated lipoprotein
MKRVFLVKLAVLSLAVIVGAVGCKKPQKGVTPIQSGATKKAPTTTNPVNPNLTPGGTVGTTDGTGGDVKETGSGFEQGSLGLIEGMVPDTDYFAAQTVLFDFDSSLVKSSEQSKAQAVGDEMKAKPQAKLMIDGHCDERGTEEYNRSLGERRALALREFLIRYGLSPEQVFTRSFGEDMPADTAHDEEAWRKNRRGEFILLLPK